jgi:hypothetical protein
MDAEPRAKFIWLIRPPSWWPWPEFRHAPTPGNRGVGVCRSMSVRRARTGEAAAGLEKLYYGWSRRRSSFCLVPAAPSGPDTLAIVAELAGTEP